MTAATLLWISVVIVFIVFLTYNIARSSAYGSLRRKDVLCEDMTGYPHNVEVFQVITGPEGNPIHNGTEKTFVVYERRGFFGRGVPRPHHFERDDYELIPGPANKRVSHPVYQKPRIRIGIKNYENVRGQSYGQLRQGYMQLYDFYVQEKLRREEAIHFNEEQTDREVERAKKWKDAVSLPPPMKKPGMGGRV